MGFHLVVRRIASSAIIDSIIFFATTNSQGTVGFLRCLRLREHLEANSVSR